MTPPSLISAQPGATFSDARDGTLLDRETLHTLSGHAVGLLSRLGVGPGDRLVVLAESELSVFLLLLGMARAGVSALVLRPDTPRQRVEEVAAAAGALGVLLASPHPDLPSLLEESLAEAIAGADEVEPPPVDPDAEAVVLFSSGSTGPARGVRLSHAAVSDGARRVHHYTDRFRARVGALPFRLYTITGYRLSLYGAVAGGGRTVAVPPVASTPALLGECAAHGAEVVHVGTGFVRACVRLGTGVREILPQCLRFALAGGGALTAAERGAFVAATGLPLVHAYGATETAGTCAGAVDLPDGPPAIGLGVPLLPVRILGEDGVSVPAGVVGAIEITPLATSLGYLGGGGEGPVRPGDLGWLDAAGNLHVRGRAARTWASPAGEKVQLEDLENIVRETFGVEACAAPLPVGSHLGLIVEGGSDLWIAKAKARLAEVVPAYAVPTLWHSVPTLPRLANGKADLEAVRSLLGTLA